MSEDGTPAARQRQVNTKIDTLRLPQFQVTHFFKKLKK